MAKEVQRSKAFNLFQMAQNTALFLPNLPPVGDDGLCLRLTGAEQLMVWEILNSTHRLLDILDLWRLRQGRVLVTPVELLGLGGTLRAHREPQCIAPESN